MSTWDAVRELPLQIDGYRLEPLEKEVAREFTLRRTEVVLAGAGEEGRGEDIDYDPDVQLRFQRDGGKLPFAGEHTLESFSLLQAGQPEYRRWAYESAALDLALRQAGTSLGDANRPRGAAADVRRLDAHGRGRRLERALPGAALQARRRPRVDGRADRVAAARPRRHRRPEGRVPRRVRRTAGRRAVRARCRGVPERVARGPGADAGDDARARAASRPGHVGRRDPRVERRRGAAVRRRAA